MNKSKYLLGKPSSVKSMWILHLQKSELVKLGQIKNWVYFRIFEKLCSCPIYIGYYSAPFIVTPVSEISRVTLISGLSLLKSIVSPWFLYCLFSFSMFSYDDHFSHRNLYPSALHHERNVIGLAKTKTICDWFYYFCGAESLSITSGSFISSTVHPFLIHPPTLLSHLSITLSFTP